MMLLAVAILILGILSLLYYGVVISYSGIGSSFSWIWLLLGIFCFAVFFIIKYIIRHEVYVIKPLRIIIITVVAAGILAFTLIEATIVINAHQEADNGADYLLILGAQVRGTTVTRSLKERLDAALIYLEDNPKTKVIVSGGRGIGEDITEAEAMRRYLTAKGVAADRITIEEASTDTNENIRFSKDIIKDINAKVVIVTNGFHVFRGVSIAKKQGFTNVQGLAAKSDPILFINYYVREVFGVTKDWVFGNL